MVALDATNGKFCRDFGKGGEIDLVPLLRNKQSYGDEYEQTSPPAVIGDLIVVGSAIADNNSTVGATGEVRAFDTRTGALRWTWDPVPQDPADPAYKTWAGAAAHRTGGANTWSIIAADPARSRLPADLEPQCRLLRRHAPGRQPLRQLGSRAARATGKVVWHFQTVHHDLWDYDNASPPALITLPDGRAAVLQGTKTAQLFVLDRETGAPLFPVEERAVPTSDIPGEVTSPTQPLSSLSTGFRTLTKDDIWGATPEDLTECRARYAGLRNDGPFTPHPSAARCKCRQTSVARIGAALPTTATAALPSCLTTASLRWSS